MKILIVCGGRTYARYGLVDAAIHAEQSQIRAIVSGEQSGADSHAKNSATLRRIKYRQCVAKWALWREDAGPLRNEEMLQVARELAEAHEDDTVELWAFREDLWKPDPLTGRNGTLDMVGRAVTQGIPARWYSDTLLASSLKWDERVVVG
jgi:hypothetical protein